MKLKHYENGEILLVSQEGYHFCIKNEADKLHQLLGNIAVIGYRSEEEIPKDLVEIENH